MPRILYIQFTDPAGYPPLEHSAELLARRGWNVVFLGLKTAHPFEFAPLPRISVHRLGFTKGGWRQKLQYIGFFFWTLGWTLVWRPEWIYASDPLVCPVAWWIRRLTGVRIVYHEHDSPSRDGIVNSFMSGVLSYRNRLANDAELCVLPQEARAREFSLSTGRQNETICVWNCATLDEVNKYAAVRDETNRKSKSYLTLYYHGSITPERFPVEVILAACQFKGAVRVRIAGYETLGSVGYTRELMRVAASRGVDDIIEVLGTAPRTNVLCAAAMADVGLSLMPKRSDDLNMQFMVGASNKPFDYMASGLPFIVTDLPIWNETFVKPGYALVVDPDDSDSIAIALQWYLEHPVERREMGLRARERVRAEWNYERMFAPVLAKIERGAAR